MKMCLFTAIFLTITCATAQTQNGKVVPKVTMLPIEDGAVTVVRLGAGFTTSVRLPEEISSVVIGNPASFKAAHSETEPRLVFLKPTTTLAAESNALITTQSGQQISLHLISGGQSDDKITIDFVLEYRRPHGALVGASGNQSFLIPESRSVSLPVETTVRAHADKLDIAGTELEKQKAVSSPIWEGKEILAAAGKSIQVGQQTLLGFSVLNHSNRTIELLPPQIELSGAARHTKGKGRTKAEPVAISEYRVTSRRLAPGERADGVVMFERPAFKESSEKLQLQLTEASQVDRPILVPVPFTATIMGGGQ